MQSLYCLAFTFLCSLSFLSAVLSIECNDSQYQWPRTNPKFCCTRCPPGKHMQAKRPENTCDIQCSTCMHDQYMDRFNLEYGCNYCRKCQGSNMEYESPCNSTHNAVCRCKAGYRCRDQTCEGCERIPTAITHARPSPPATAVSTTLLQPSSPTKPQPTTQDTMWLLAIVVLLCAVVALFVVAKIHSLQRWIRYKLVNILDKEPAPVSTSSEDEEVSKPIQEACGKCDQLLDV